MNRATSKRTKKPTIALLMDWFSNQYLLSIWTGVTQAAQVHHTNVIAVFGGRLQWPEGSEANSNIMYQLVHPGNVDGVLISSSSMFSHLVPEERIKFLQQFQPLPVTLIGEQIAGYSSVSVDNSQGLRDVLVHLIEKHGCQRLAFIGGPEQNWESRQRFTVFRDVLQAYGLPIDERLIFHGDFLERSGRQAVETFYADDLAPCDALVAANDFMAMGALEALQARGVWVPDDVLLTGFDNFEDSHLSVPMLTTVNQPTLQMGYRAFELLQEQMTGKNSEIQHVTLPTNALIRQSCGCYGATHPSPQHVVELTERKTAVVQPLPHALQKHKAQILTEIKNTLAQSSFGQFDPVWAQHLYAAFLQSWEDDQPAALLEALESTAQRMIRRELNIQVLADCLHILFRFSKMAANDAQTLAKLDDRQLQTRLAIDTLVQRGDLKYRYNTFLRNLRVRLFSERLLNQTDLHGAFEEMSRSLPMLGVSRFYLVLYDQQAMQADLPELPKWSYLAYAHSENGSITPNLQEQRFLTRELLPGYLRASSQFSKTLLFPLYSDAQQFGYLIMESGSDGARYHYDLIRYYVSLALQSLLPKLQLIADRNQLESEVSSKAYELALANEQLKAYTAELERRNWELQQFAHVAQYELQDPLRNIRSLGDRLQTQYTPILAERGSHYVARMQNASARMQALIDDLLVFTQVSSPATMNFSPVGLNQVVHKVVLTLETEIAALNGRIEVDTLPTIEVNASQMYQLFYNLIHNALKFHRRGVPPVVTIKSRLKEDAASSPKLWEITVADNGLGFNEKYRERIFTMFQRVHSGQNASGTGIGLAVCRRVVELHNGSITASSQKGMGTTFSIVLPSKQS